MPYKNADDRREYQRRYRELNRDTINAQERQRNLVDPEPARARKKRWREENREKHNASNRAYRERKKLSGS